MPHKPSSVGEGETLNIYKTDVIFQASHQSSSDWSKHPRLLPRILIPFLHAPSLSSPFHPFFVDLLPPPSPFAVSIFLLLLIYLFCLPLMFFSIHFSLISSWVFGHCCLLFNIPALFVGFISAFSRVIFTFQILILSCCLYYLFTSPLLRESV